VNIDNRECKKEVRSIKLKLYQIYSATNTNPSHFNSQQTDAEKVGSREVWAVKLPLVIKPGQLLEKDYEIEFPSRQLHEKPAFKDLMTEYETVLFNTLAPSTFGELVKVSY